MAATATITVTANRGVIPHDAPARALWRVIAGSFDDGEPDTYREFMPRRPPSVLIIGAGFGGIGLGILLKRAGVHSFTILEKADSLGGTWRENTYPGAACDVPSHMYRYSFAPKPDWSRKWAPQAEILQYMTELADESGVADHIRFDVEVQRARWDEQAREWIVTVVDGRTIRADVLVSAVGQLHHPAVRRYRVWALSPVPFSIPHGGPPTWIYGESGWAWSEPRPAASRSFRRLRGSPSN